MNPYLIDKNEQNCLFYAVQNQKYDIIEYLLGNGIDVNQIDKMETNCLKIAYDINDRKIVELLKAKGAVLPFLPIIQKKKKKINKNHKLSLTKLIDQNNNETSLTQEINSYTMVKVLDDGSKIPLSVSEIFELKNSNPLIKSLLENKDEFNKEIKKQNDKYKLTQGLSVSDCWETKAKELMRELWKCKDACMFHKKINPIKLDIPDYLNIVKNPMDFRTIRTKLDNLLYTNCKEFSQDVELVFNNCFLYNGVRYFLFIIKEIKFNWKKM